MNKMSDVEDLDDINNIVELFDTDDIPLIINNNNEVTNGIDILNLPVDFGENQLNSINNINNLPTGNQPNNVSTQKNMDGVGQYRKTENTVYNAKYKSTDKFIMDCVNDTTVVETNIDKNQTLKKEPATDYNPYEHRNIRHPTTYFDTLIHLLKASLGTGILAMPDAFKNSGYVFGTLGTVVIGILCTYTIHLLVSTSYEMCIRRKVPSMTYPDTTEAAFKDGPRITRKFAPYARFLTNLFLVSYQIGASCVYVVFIAKNVKSVVENYVDGKTDERMYMMYILFPLIAIACVRNLKLLAPFSSLANITTIMSFMGIFYYIFREAPTFSGHEPIGKMTDMPKFFNTVLFAMAAIGVVLPLQNEMANPKQFGTTCGVLNTAMVPITAIYTIVGLFGYIKFGEETSGSITLNLPPSDKLVQGIQIMLSIAIYIGYALSNYVAFDIMWTAIKPKVNNKIIWEYSLRMGIVLITYFVAVVIPNLSDLIGLIGALCLSFVGIALPAIINFLTFVEDYKKKGRLSYGMFCLRNLIIVVVSIFALIIGVYVSMSDIIKHISEQSETS